LKEKTKKRVREINRRKKIVVKNYCKEKNSFYFDNYNKTINNSSIQKNQNANAAELRAIDNNTGSFFLFSQNPSNFSISSILSFSL